MFPFQLISLLFGVCQFGVGLSEVINKGQGNWTYCEQVTNITQRAFVDWPHRLTCGGFTDLILEEVGEDDYSNEDYYPDEPYVVCIVRDAERDEVVFRWNGTLNDIELQEHFLPDVKSNHSTTYHVELHAADLSRCHSRQIVQLVVSESAEPACDHQLMSTSGQSTRQTNVEAVLELECSDTDVPKRVDKDHHDFNVTWQRNCSDVRNISGLVVDKEGLLNFNGVTYDHPGIYTCNRVYKGQKSKPIHFKICVRPKKSTGTPRLICTKSLHHVDLGTKTMFECSLETGQGHESDNSVTSKWYKLSHGSGSQVCRNEVPSRTNNGSDPRTRCNFKTVVPCYLHVLTEEERIRDEQMLDTTMRLWIDDVQKSDLGSYMLSVRIRGVVVNATFALTLNPLPPLRSSRMVALVCLVVLAFGLVLFVFLWWKRFYLLVFYKRKFANYELDDKKYGAFVSYHFSTEMDKFAQQQTKDATSATLERLESLGYRVYDQYRDGHESELKIESSVNAMRQCHRVVIVLTSEYVKDQWSVFQLQKGFQTMIESKSKIIFVVVPGTKEFIQQHSQGDDTKRMICRVMKLHHVIPWSDRKDFDAKLFKRRLEWSMPKLPTTRSLRHPSTTSSILSTHYTNGFQRTMSVETQMTEAGSPKPKAEQQFTCFVIENEHCQANASM